MAAYNVLRIARLSRQPASACAAAAPGASSSSTHREHRRAEPRHVWPSTHLHPATLVVRAAFNLAGRIGKSGAVRSRAWTSDCSSTHSARAFSGSFMHRPTMSRTFSLN